MSGSTWKHPTSPSASLPGTPSCSIVRAWSALSAALEETPEIRLLFVVTDSLAQYQQLVAELSPEVQSKMLYEDYLENFELNTGGVR